MDGSEVAVNPVAVDHDSAPPQKGFISWYNLTAVFATHSILDANRPKTKRLPHTTVANQVG